MAKQVKIPTTKKVKLKETSIIAGLDIKEYLIALANTLTFTKYNVHCLTRANIFSGLCNRPDLVSKPLEELAVLADKLNQDFYNIDQARQNSQATKE